MVFYAPAFNLERWKMALADPDARWKAQHSAYELARAWANIRNLPKPVQEMVDRSGIDALRDLDVLLKLPEHPVALDDVNDPAMNELFVLARSASALVSMAVAGRGLESPGPIVREAYDGTEDRLAFLMDVLGLSDKAAALDIRSKWLLGAASAVMEAKRYHAGVAVFLVHDFGQDASSFSDFAAFAALFGVKAEPGKLAVAPEPANGVQLVLGWIKECS